MTPKAALSEMTESPAIQRSTSGPSAGEGGSPPPGSWLRERIWLVDLLVALGVFLYNLPTMPTAALHLIDDPGSYIALAVLSLVICAVYLWRRRYPLAVLITMLAVACAQFFFGAPVIMADVMLLFALYNVATRFAWRVSLPAAAAVVCWLLIAVVPNLSAYYLDLGQLGALVVITIWVWTWGTLVRIRRDHVAGLRERAEQLEREREAQTRIAVAEERARIAGEIHDIVSHSLSVVVVMSEGAAAKTGSEPERAKEAMLTVRDTGRTALAEMRRMLGVLRDDEPGSQAPQPGIGDLERLVEESSAAGVPTVLFVEGTPADVPESVGLAVYRVVQEALTNTRRHAGPGSRADVRLRYDDEGVQVRVTDDGTAPVAAPATGGHGLVGMRERVTAHGGAFRAGPRAEGDGFEVTAVFPAEGES